APQLDFTTQGCGGIRRSQGSTNRRWLSVRRPSQPFRQTPGSDQPATCNLQPETASPVARKIRKGRHPARLCPRRHHHARNGVYCDSREHAECEVRSAKREPCERHCPKRPSQTTCRFVALLTPHFGLYAECFQEIPAKNSIRDNPGICEI